ncbi:MAG: hypothetical protein ABIO17_12375 [Pseudoxanthomonas sp.]
MTMDSQQYADLVAHGYGVEVDGKKGQMEHRVGEKIDLEGVTYKVLEYMDKPSGYQGAIYKRVETGEIVAVHRGAEFDREAIKDGAASDHFGEFRIHASEQDRAIAGPLNVHRMQHFSFQEA